MISFRDLILVLTGSAIGGTARYFCSVLVNRFNPGKWPWGTFGINLIGCLIIGMVYAIASRFPEKGHSIKLLMATGFCGGYTTFSAFAYENIQLLKQGEPLLSLLYISGSVILGILFVWLGAQIIK